MNVSTASPPKIPGAVTAVHVMPYRDLEREQDPGESCDDLVSKDRPRDEKDEHEHDGSHENGDELHQKAQVVVGPRSTENEHEEVGRVGGSVGARSLSRIFTLHEIAIRRDFHEIAIRRDIATQLLGVSRKVRDIPFETTEPRSLHRVQLRVGRKMVGKENQRRVDESRHRDELRDKSRVATIEQPVDESCERQDDPEAREGHRRLDRNECGETEAKDQTDRRDDGSGEGRHPGQ